MIKAIIFDCFGVLTTDGWLPFKKKYFGHSPAVLSEITELNKRSNGGDLSYGDFITLIASKANISQQSARDQIDTNVANKELLEYIERLRQQYKIGMLSNVGKDWLAKLFTTEQIDLFDETSLSYETSFVKPDVRAYQDIAKKLDISPDQAVFVDDQLSNCDGAVQAGMQAIHYKNFDQTKAELEKILAPVADN